MSRKISINLIFLLTFVIGCARSEDAVVESDKGYYTIVGATTVRANSEYHVAVSSLNLKGPVDMKIGIKANLTDTDSQYDNSKLITLLPDTTQTVPLKIGSLLPGEYKLYGKGINGLEFENETDLSYNVKEFNIFVQTDKSIYKPGDTLRFRVLFLDANLKGIDVTKSSEIFISDPGQNRIKQWKNLKTTKGVFSAELPLSSDPNLGKWTINIEVENEKATKDFEVDEYVLPKFEVIVDASRHAAFKDSKIKAVIRSKYTYGKYVKGEVTVTAYPTVYVGSLQPFEKQLITRKTVPLDGKAVVEISIADELGLKDETERDVVIEAVVEEALTGRKQNGTTTVTIHKSKYAISIDGETSKFKPGLQFVAWIKVNHHDGTPVQDKTNKVRVEYNNEPPYQFRPYNWRELEEETGITTTPKPPPMSEELTLNENGMAKIVIDCDPKWFRLVIKAKYLDVSQDYFSVYKDSNEDNEFIQVELKTENPEVNKEVVVQVTSTEDMKQIVYQIIGRGDVLVSNTVDVPNAKVVEFKFMASFSMVPKAKIHVYYISKSGDFVSDKIDVTFPTVFQNPVKINLSKTQSKPGEDIDITVSTNPNSFVGLLGVDQSVLLLKKGNDLEQTKIFDSLKDFEEQSQRWYPYRGKRSYYFGGRRFPAFTDAGTVVLTNAKSKEPEYHYYTLALYTTTVPPTYYTSTTIPQNENTEKQSEVKEVQVTIRKDFPESWIWEDLNGISE